jgi:hypothetical protein
MYFTDIKKITFIKAKTKIKQKSNNNNNIMGK